MQLNIQPIIDRATRIIETHAGLNDMHTLFGCICALAELQSFLPGEIVSDVPLKLVLDRRPFI